MYSKSLNYVTGMILPFGGDTPPTGWLICDGSVLNRTTYANLYAAILTRFGNPGGNSFYLPDLRGVFLRGCNNTCPRDPDAATRENLCPGGNLGNNVGSYQRDCFYCHCHCWGSEEYTGSWVDGYNDVYFHTAYKPWWTHCSFHNTPQGVVTETRCKNLSINYIIKT